MREPTSTRHLAPFDVGAVYDAARFVMPFGTMTSRVLVTSFTVAVGCSSPSASTSEAVEAPATWRGGMSCALIEGPGISERTRVVDLVLVETARNVFDSQAGSWRFELVIGGKPAVVAPATAPVEVGQIRMIIAPTGYIGGGNFQWSGTIDGIAIGRPRGVTTGGQQRRVVDPDHISGEAQVPGAGACAWDLVREIARRS